MPRRRAAGTSESPGNRAASDSIVTGRARLSRCRRPGPGSVFARSALEPGLEALERLGPVRAHLRDVLRTAQLVVLDRDRALRGPLRVEVRLDARLAVDPRDPHRLRLRRLADGEAVVPEPARALLRLLPGPEERLHGDSDGLAARHLP